jgi:hypothetical protein
MIKLVNLLEDISNEKKRVPKDRLVYAYTFPEQKLAYIGLTGDEKKRASSHMSLKAQKTTAVSRFIRETGLRPDYKVVSATKDNPSGFVDENIAKDLECNYMKEYEAKGYTLLNLAKCGSLGGSIRDEEAIINSVDNFINSPSTSVDTGRLLSGSDYVKDYIANYNQEKKVFNKIKDIIVKNNITSTNQLRNLEGEENFRRISKLIEDWSREHRGEDDWQKKLFPENTRGLEKPAQAAEAFLAEPDNLDKDQLKLITKRTYKEIAKSGQEEAFLNKLKKIIAKYNVTTLAQLTDLTKEQGKSKKYSTSVVANIYNHDSANKKEHEASLKAKEENPDDPSIKVIPLDKWKDRLSLKESTIDDKEVLRRTIQGFELIPAKYGFGHPYVTKNGKATSDLATRINTWIQGEFNGSSIKVKYDPTYKALNFFKS